MGDDAGELGSEGGYGFIRPSAESNGGGKVPADDLWELADEMEDARLPGSGSYREAGAEIKRFIGEYTGDDADTDDTPRAVPPWEPIADWLASLPNVSCDAEYEETREPQNATQREVRGRYEKTAKTIAYEIAVNADHKPTDD